MALNTNNNRTHYICLGKGGGSSAGLKRIIVDSLPTEDIDENAIYMVLKTTAEEQNIYDEYMYINSAWEKIGSTATDLSDYYTKEQVDAKNWYGTQEEYDALTTIDPNVDYHIEGGGSSTQEQADWDETDETSVKYIQNKPTIPTKTSELENDSGFTTFSGDYEDLTNKPTKAFKLAVSGTEYNKDIYTNISKYITNYCLYLPDDSQSSGVDSGWNGYTIINYYNKSNGKLDLYGIDKHRQRVVVSITSAGTYTRTEQSGGIIIKQGDTTKGSYLVNQFTNKTITLDAVPTATSQLTNDSDYTTKAYVDEQIGNINNILETI